jgi:hypothetical protein
VTGCHKHARLVYKVDKLARVQIKVVLLDILALHKKAQLLISIPLHRENALPSMMQCNSVSKNNEVRGQMKETVR